MNEFEKLSDKQLLSMLLYGEARGEPVEGQIAVANVVRNRVKKPSWWGSTWQEVILKPMQFSCFNQNDPNYQHLIKMIQTPIEMPTIMRQLLWIAEGILYDLLEDNTNGACYYMTKLLYNSNNRPIWAERLKLTCVKGNHVFLKEM